MRNFWIAVAEPRGGSALDSLSGFEILKFEISNENHAKRRRRFALPALQN
jgi:hypothetical protein